MKNTQKGIAIGILAALSISHGLNDAMQSIISAAYPMLKNVLSLNYAEIGLVAMTFQISSSIMQCCRRIFLSKNI